MRLVDFHCHLDLYPDHVGAIEECERAGIYTLAVTTTPRAWPRNRDLTRTTQFVRPALGLHPQLVGNGGEDEVALWEQYLPEARYVGEVGLDGSSQYRGSLNEQKRVFRTVLTRCSELGGRVLTVHSVRSTGAVLDLVEECLPRERGTVVLHWFVGSDRDVSRAVRLGCYFSVNAAMEKSQRGRRLLEYLPLEKTLTETDGPFTGMGDRPARPSDVSEIVQILAKRRRMATRDVAAAIMDNLRRLLS